MEEQKQPIYRFRLNRSRNKIQVTKYDDWEIKSNRWGYIFYVCYTENRKHRTSFGITQLDKMFNNTVYSHNPDIMYARDIMIEALNLRVENLKKEIDGIYTTMHSI